MRERAELERRLRAIGVRVPGALTGPGTGPPGKGGALAGSGPGSDIERTLLAAAAAVPEDPRCLGWLLSWVEVHGAVVIVEKLAKLRRAGARAAARVHGAGAGTETGGALADDAPGDVPWLTAVGLFATGRVPMGSRWKKLVEPPSRPLALGGAAGRADGTGGADEDLVPWLAEANLLVAGAELAVSPDAVLAPSELVRRHRQYRNRYLYGASWRADIVTAIEAGCSTPTEIARRIGCSYEPAHRVLRQYRLAMRAP